MSNLNFSRLEEVLFLEMKSLLWYSCLHLFMHMRICIYLYITPDFTKAFGLRVEFSPS